MANLGKGTIKIGFDIDWSTVEMCLRIIEMYLNDEDHAKEELVICCSEFGNWDLEIYDRLKEKNDEM